MPLVSGTIFYPGAIGSEYAVKKIFDQNQYEAVSPRTPIIFNPLLPSGKAAFADGSFALRRLIGNYGEVFTMSFFLPVLPKNSPKSPGSVWTEGTDLRFVDKNGVEWSFTGRLYTGSAI